jgi:DNA-directed RNA polymerase specialized sigma24 family protein
MSLGLAREDAEDEVQDIFTRVKLDHADLGRAYLLRAVANQVKKRRRLDQIVEGLPEPGCTVFRLCCQVGWTAGRVALLMGMTTKAVERVQERVQARVRKWLEDAAHGDDGWAPV